MMVSLKSVFSIGSGILLGAQIMHPVDRVAYAATLPGIDIVPSLLSCANIQPQNYAELSFNGTLSDPRDRFAYFMGYTYFYPDGPSDNQANSVIYGDKKEVALGQAVAPAKQSVALKLTIRVL
jgi:hypothetical protein